jgi:hypothetical protein
VEFFARDHAPEIPKTGLGLHSGLRALADNILRRLLAESKAADDPNQLCSNAATRNRSAMVAGADFTDSLQSMMLTGPVRLVRNR